MPTVLRVGNFRIAILTRNEHEPPHVHIEHPDGVIVILLDEKIRQARLREKSRGIGVGDVRAAIEIVNRSFDDLLDAWERIHRSDG